MNAHAADYRKAAAARIAAQPVNRCRRCRIEIPILNTFAECGTCAGMRRREEAAR